MTWLCLVRAGRRNYFQHTAVVVPTHAHSIHPHLTKFSLQCVRVIESKWRHVKHCTSVTLTDQLPAWIGVYEFDYIVTVGNMSKWLSKLYAIGNKLRSKTASKVSLDEDDCETKCSGKEEGERDGLV